MKTIQVSDEMYEFLMNLSKELNTQDHRCTAMPYFFQVQHEKQVGVPSGCGVEGWFCDGTILTSDEEIKEAVFEYKEWELGNSEHEKLYKEMDWLDIEDVMEENYRKVNIDTEKVYANAFLTEKACKQHIAANKHHYSNPQDFLTHAFRNPELEKVMEFLCGITNGKIHK